MLKLNKRQRKVSSQETSIVTIDVIHDLFALKIVTNDYLDCYKALGVIHKEYDIDSSRFKEFIAVPKTNLYQSLYILFSILIIV